MSGYSFTDWKSGVLPPIGWDVADAIADGWTFDDVDGLMRASVCEVLPPFEVEPPEAANENPPAPHLQEAVAGKPEAPTPRSSAGPIPQARTTTQEKPEGATVTSIKTRVRVAADDSWQLKLIFNEDNKIKPGVSLNWSLFLKNHPEMAGVFAWDAFKYKVMLRDCPPWEAPGAHWEMREIRESDYARTVMWLESHYMTPKGSNIAAVIQEVAEEGTFDQLSDYLEGLAWDGESRIDSWMVDYLGAAGSSAGYASVVGASFLISAVARGLKPGCKVDTMPILEGPQGLKKSGALEALFSKAFFTDGLSDIGSKDAKMEMQGVWGLEVAEMHRFSQAETGEIKKFLTQKTDRFRPPYGKVVIEAPRRVVLAGTINPDGNPYLKDSTGARRFWPIVCTRIDLDAISRDRDQLWAEAVAAFKAGKPWWVQEDEQDAVAAEQAKRTDVDVWTDLLAKEVKGLVLVAQSDLLKALGIQMREADYRHAGRLARVMKTLGWTMDSDRSNGGKRVIFRAPPQEEPGVTDQW